MTKKVKKKVKFKLIPFFFVIIIFSIIFFIYKYAEDIKIKNIYIYGNEIISDQEIIDMAELNNYPSFIKLSISKINKKLSSNKIIKKVTTKKKLISTIEIYIEEYEPVLLKDNKIVLENKEKVDLINIKLPVLNNMEENDIYTKLIGEITKLKTNVRKSISEIYYDPSEYDKERFLLYMDDGNHIYINLNKFDKLNYYEEIYPSLNNKKGTLYLDSGNHFEIFKK